MIYLDLLKLASPEAIIAVTALAVLGIGLASTRASGICSFAATFGLSFIYGMSGTTELVAIGQKFATQPMQPLLFVGILMTLVGLAFKVAAAPFHLWAPDAYQGAPVPSAAFIASGSKVASFVVLGKIVLVGFAPVHGSAAWHAMIAGWSPVLAALAALSILVGNLVARVPITACSGLSRWRCLAVSSRSIITSSSSK